MKHRKILLCSFLLFGLTACGNAVEPIANHFKEYSFTARANNTNEITNGIAINSERISSVELLQEQYVGLQNKQQKETIKTIVKIFDDSAKPDFFIASMDQTSSIVSYADGVKLTEKKNVFTEEWQGAAGKIYVATKTTQNGKATETYNATTISSSAKAHKSEQLKSFMPNINIGNNQNSFWYVNSDGSYTGVYSNVNESVSSVDWGKSGKELKQTVKRQYVYKVNKNFELVEYYVYEEQKSNRDTATGKWYSSQKVLASAYQHGLYKYDKRSSASVESLNSNRQIYSLESATLICNQYEAPYLNGTPKVDINTKVVRNVNCTKNVGNNGTTILRCSVDLDYGYAGYYIAQNYSLKLNLEDYAGRTIEKTVGIDLPIIIPEGVIILEQNRKPAYLCNVSEEVKTVNFVFEFNGKDIISTSITIE